MKFFDRKKIAERGNYAQLVDSGKEFSVVMKEYGVVGKHEDKKEEEAEEKKEEGEKKKKAAADGGGGKLIQAEERETGAVSPKIYWQYIKAGGAGYLILFFTGKRPLILAVMHSSCLFFSFWISDHKQCRTTGSLFGPTTNSTAASVSRIPLTLPSTSLLEVHLIFSFCEL